jgi:hypothetical protein
MIRMYGVEENMFYANRVGKGYRAHYCRMEDCEYTFQVQTDLETTSWPIILARSLMNAIIVKVSANLEAAERSLDKKPTWAATERPFAWNRKILSSVSKDARQKQVPRSSRHAS